ncbi:MAG TPA: lysine biosynthesis protein LysW [archaeon]|nr:lysine biosynthesis protein LysW [archaeon]HLD80847.1 lysine biosynthesis protein LysW [archaeon]
MECVACGAELQLDESKLEKGEIFECKECGTELEVVSVNPLQIDKAPEEGEDWGE